MTFAEPYGIGLNFQRSVESPARFMPPAPRPPSVERLVQRLQWDDLDPGHLRRLVELARDEDLSGLGLRRRPTRTGDLSTLSATGLPRQGTAVLIAREALVVCGLRLVPLVLSAFGGRVAVQFGTKDGTRLGPGGIIATLHGDPRVLLPAERTLLNFLQRLSGIATHTRRHVAALGPGRTRLLDTRKTTPGYRMLEKYAVACGGGWNHRLGLFDRVMLKDNHLALLGCSDQRRGPRTRVGAPGKSALAAAVAAARRAAPEAPVEIEVDRLEQVRTALAAGPDVILFDNFPLARLRRALDLVNGRVFTEASGGITLRTLPRLGGLGLDFVSTGALVHHSVWVDVALDWRSP